MLASCVCPQILQHEEVRTGPAGPQDPTWLLMMQDDAHQSCSIRVSCQSVGLYDPWPDLSQSWLQPEPCFQGRCLHTLTQQLIGRPEVFQTLRFCLISLSSRCELDQTSDFDHQDVHMKIKLRKTLTLNTERTCFLLTALLSGCKVSAAGKVITASLLSISNSIRYIMFTVLSFVVNMVYLFQQLIWVQHRLDQTWSRTVVKHSKDINKMWQLLILTLSASVFCREPRNRRKFKLLPDQSRALLDSSTNKDSDLYFENLRQVLIWSLKGRRRVF